MSEDRDPQSEELEVPGLPPRRHIEPLAPRPGAFNLVLGEAAGRRYRRLTAVTGVSAVFLAGVWGGLTMGGGVTGVQQTLAGLAEGVGDPSPSPEVLTTTTQAAEVPLVDGPPARKKRAAPDAATSALVATTAAEQPVLDAMVRGTAVDRDGSPVAGLYVYTGRFTGGSFVPGEAAADLTGSSGRFAVPCSGGPVLLTSWPLNTTLSAIVDGAYGATYLAAPVCSRDQDRQVTTVSEGQVVEGVVGADAACPDVSSPLWLWLNGDRTTSLRLGRLAAGEAFRVGGVPAGEHLLVTDHGQSPVVVEGADLVQDVTLGCPPAPSPSAEPSPSTSGSPTPTPTGTPVPSDTAVPLLPAPTAPSQTQAPGSSPGGAGR